MATTSINLADLDGSNGFRLNVEVGHSLRSVSNAGDVNGDGLDDLSFSIYGDYSRNYSTSSYVVFGKVEEFEADMDLSELDGSNGFRLDLDGGRRLSTAGDVNGDGFDDVIIGTGISSYVVFGKASGFEAEMDLSGLDGSNGFRLNREGDASTAGDVNGDGFDDVIIGNYVVFGKASGFEAEMDLSELDGSNGFRMKGAYGDILGVSVSTAGDVNGDGFDDVIIGTRIFFSDDGPGYVVFGKASGFEADMDLSELDGSNGFRLDGEIRSVSNAGDVNGDGFDDVIVGEPGASPNGRYSGSSYVVFGKVSGFEAGMDLSELDGKNGFRVDGLAARDYLGASVSAAGDVNGDGFDDVIIGAPDANPNGRQSGSSYVVFGKASEFDATVNLMPLDGVLEGGRSGSSVSGVGDVNGDGFDDLMVGAGGGTVSYGGNAYNSYYTPSSGYVIFGSSDFTDGNEVDFPGTPGDDIFTGTKAAERFEGGDGNDRMIGRGGADSFDGGAGNDYIRISDDTFQWVDGGSGTDILGLAGNGFNLDLSGVIDKIHGIETIGLYGVGDNSLTLTAQDVIDLSDTTNTLKIKGNAGDSVVGLSSGWTDGGIRGNFHEYTQGDAVILVGLAVTTDSLIT
ncbi:integrin alpha [Nitrosomonas ureae]|uniref:FG-GAP repeat-containing protein n=1 Tax=Nitrosomonas ureae TaxID=44577 RepID=A0A1H5UL22_9PROT|nr:integrin alpha [Nitrosomonas ureae]SEF75742.1 FG-GAP repeat-containing protein [Nitrosomonas ureae]